MIRNIVSPMIYPVHDAGNTDLGSIDSDENEDGLKPFPVSFVNQGKFVTLRV